MRPHRWIAVALLIGFSWLVRNTVLWQGVGAWDPSDECDYAQLGRNIARGNGFVTSASRPMELCVTPGVPHPELTRGPGLPLILGMSMAVLGENAGALRLPLGLFVLLAGLVAAVLLHRLRPERPGVLLAACLFGFSPVVLLYGTAICVEMPYAFFVTLALLLAFFKGRPSWFLQGVALGLAACFRFTALLFAPAVLLPRARNGLGKGSWKNGVVFLGGCLLVATPLLLRNLLATGYLLSPVYRYSCLIDIHSQEGYAVWCELSLPEAVPALLDGLQERGGQGVGEALRRLYRMSATRNWDGLTSTAFPRPDGIARLRGGAWFLAVCVGFCWTVARRPWVALAAVGMVLSHLVVSALLGFCHFRYWFFLYPLLCVLAGLGGSVGLRLCPERFAAPLGALVCLLLAWDPILGGSMKEEARLYREQNPFRAAGQEVGRRFPERALVCTDIPWQVAWFGDRRTVWLPYAPSDMAALEEFVEVDGVVLTELWTPLRVGWNEEWVRLLTHPDRAAEHLGPGWAGRLGRVSGVSLSLFRHRSSTMNEDE